MTIVESKLIEQGVIQKSRNQLIYKYRSIEQGAEILASSQLYFSTPDKFNDPFDCQLSVNSQNTDQEIYDYFVRYFGKSIPDNVLQDLIKQTKDNPDRWQEILDESIKQTTNKTGVCCFSINMSNLLLWSHYAEQHKGICLGFDIEKDADFFKYPLMIRYSSVYPIFNHIKEQQDLVDKLLQTKSKDWSYEEELRIMKINSSGLFKFKKEALVEIIFGSKSSDDDINRIINIAKENDFNNLVYSKARINKREFKLDISRI